MVGGGQCSSVIVVILTLLGDDRGAPSGWRIIHSNNNNTSNQSEFKLLTGGTFDTHDMDYKLHVILDCTHISHIRQVNTDQLQKLEFQCKTSVLLGSCTIQNAECHKA